MHSYGDDIEGINLTLGHVRNWIGQILGLRSDLGFRFAWQFYN